jgi:signal transduction histidine kinase
LEVGAYAEAAERERISRELHDRVAHSMGVAHQTSSSTKRWRRKTPCGPAVSYTRRRR